MILNKKADVHDFLILLIVMVTLGISIFFGAKIWAGVEEGIKNNINMTDNPEINNSLAGVNRAVSIYDPMFAVFFFGFYLAILISVFFLDTQPGYLIFAIILFLITIFLAGIFADVFTTMAEHESLEEQLDDYPITYHIFNNLPIYLIGMAIIFVVVLYASRRTQ